MKKERIFKADGRYLIYYSFEPAELSQTKPRIGKPVRQKPVGAKGRGR